MIDHTSKFRLFWDILIVLMNIVNLIFIPIDVAFQPEFINSGGYIAFDYIFDFIFLIDLIFNFRTSFADDHGEKIYDKKQIAKRYVPTLTFVCDCLAICQLHSIFGNSDLKFLKVLKVVAITRISKIILHLTV